MYVVFQAIKPSYGACTLVQCKKTLGRGRGCSFSCHKAKILGLWAAKLWEALVLLYSIYLEKEFTLGSPCFQIESQMIKLHNQ